MVNFVSKLCLAPMVRSGEIATRLLALKYGADLVWTPEYVDKKIIQTKRVVNEQINTVDYVVEQNVKGCGKDSSEAQNGKAVKRGQNSPRVIFRTHSPTEKGKLIFQLGTSDPELAVQAANKVIADVDGIDLNCGCPKPFSTHSGMGAALLSTPDLLCSILTALVQQVGIPNNKSISCKIRLLEDYETTKSLISKICDTGITNLTIHCRTRSMRNRQDPIWKYLTRLIPFIQSKGVSVVINGNLQSRSDFENMQKAFANYEVGGMMAETAEANGSVFSKKPVPVRDVVSQFYNIAKTYNYDALPNTKFMVLNLIPGKSVYYKKFSQSRTYEDFDKVMAELEADKDDVLVNKIYTKDLQKQKSLTEEEYEKYIETRFQMMNELVKLAQESENEPAVKSENSTILREIIDETQKRSEVPLYSEKTKQHKTEALST